MSGPKTDLKDALQQSGGKFPASEPEVKENGSSPAVRQQSASRIGKKPVTVYYEKAAHLQLKVLAAELETTIQGLHEEALNGLFEKHGKPPIA